MEYSIGEEVIVKGKVTEILLSKNSTQYRVSVDGTFMNSILVSEKVLNGTRPVVESQVSA